MAKLSTVQPFCTSLLTHKTESPSADEGMSPSLSVNERVKIILSSRLNSVVLTPSYCNWGVVLNPSFLQLIREIKKTVAINLSFILFICVIKSNIKKRFVTVL